MNSWTRFLALSLVVLIVTGCGARQPQDDASQDPHSKYSVVGKWGQPVNGLRCRLAVGKPTFRSDENLTFRLDLQNISKAPMNIVLEERGWFGRIRIGQVSGMKWVPPAGSMFHKAYRTLKPDEIMSATDFSATHRRPIAKGKHVFTGQYWNRIDVSSEYFRGWAGTPVELWTGADAARPVVSGPVEIMIEPEEHSKLFKRERNTRRSTAASAR